MLPEIQKILYPTDLSENAKHAFGYAASLAQRYGAKISVFHVVEELSQNTALLLNSMLGESRWNEIKDRSRGEFEELIRENLEHFCRDMQQAFSGCDFTVEEIIIRQGQATEAIAAQIRGGDYDLVVMGTHGQGGLADAMMGSTARRVTRRSAVPVLVVRLPE
jgi:nucleotide-binding universal stress UspA family protein